MKTIKALRVILAFPFLAMTTVFLTISMIIGGSEVTEAIISRFKQ